MSIEKVEMFTIVCDGCKNDIGSNQDYSCWNDPTCAEENAMESDWIKYEGKHYCPDCYDEDEEYIRFKN